MDQGLWHQSKTNIRLLDYSRPYLDNSQLNKLQLSKAKGNY